MTQGVPSAPIARILHSSAVDGPGNRVVVFTQGCSFNCVYCHNPETIPVWRDSPDSAVGVRVMDAREVAEAALAQRPFATGLTVSGGECTLHPEFLAELFARAHAGGLSTLADSNGSRRFSTLPKVLAHLDGVLLDVKAWDEEEHRLLTGTGNEVVLENLEWLAHEGLLVEARTVVVPGLFDLEGTVSEVAKVLAKARDSRFGAPAYRLGAFRPQGVPEGHRDLVPPEGSLMAHLGRIARASGAQRVLLS